MNRNQILYDQFMKADSDYENAKEIEELSKKHREINSELNVMANDALTKGSKGQIVSDVEQKAFNDLAQKQEKVYRQMADKILKK